LLLAGSIWLYRNGRFIEELYTPIGSLLLQVHRTFAQPICGSVIGGAIDGGLKVNLSFMEERGSVVNRFGRIVMSCTYIKILYTGLRFDVDWIKYTGDGDPLGWEKQMSIGTGQE